MLDILLLYGRTSSGSLGCRPSKVLRELHPFDDQTGEQKLVVKSFEEVDTVPL